LFIIAQLNDLIYLLILIFLIWIFSCFQVWNVKNATENNTFGKFYENKQWNII